MNYQLTVANNHYVITIDNNAYIIDTGSPVSISRDGSIQMLGNNYAAPTLFSSSQFDRISEGVGMPIDGLIGNDILNGHVIVLDFGAKTISFDVPIPSMLNCIDIITDGLQMSFLLQMLNLKVPTIDIELNSKKIRAIFDTGACIPYAKPHVLKGLNCTGAIKDYGPMHGEIRANVYDCPYILGAISGNASIGEATPGIISEISIVGADAIIGPSLFSNSSYLAIDLKNMKLNF